jgi:hypothetical protein
VGLLRFWGWSEAFWGKKRAGKPLGQKEFCLRSPDGAEFFQKTYFSGCTGMGPILFWASL